MKFIIVFVFLGIGLDKINTQITLPILRTNTHILDVREGNILHEDSWEIDPQKSLDVYCARRFNKAMKITFYSDIDSMSFDLKQDQVVNFIILYGDKDSCRTQIKSLSKYHQVLPSVSDTIPFTLGRDNRIYLEGRINNSSLLKIMYDTGADGTGIAKKALGKLVNLKYDGNVTQIGSGGVTTAYTSSINKVQIGNMIWNDELITTSEKRYGKADAVIGYSLFSDKIVEIDYDIKCLIIHEKLILKSGYNLVDSRWQGYSPNLKTTLDVNDKLTSEWLILDTGCTGTIFLNKKFMVSNNLYNQMKKLSEGKTSGIGNNITENEMVILPKLSIFNHSFQNIPVVHEAQVNPISTAGNLIGMDVLKRFNTIIDYQQNKLYFKSNGLIAVPFKFPLTKTKLWLIGLFILSLITFGIIIRQRIKFYL